MNFEAFKQKTLDIFAKNKSLPTPTDEQIEKVIPQKKQRKSIFNVLWTKAKKVTEEAKEKTGKLLDEISEEEV